MSLTDQNTSEAAQAAAGAERRLASDRAGTHQTIGITLLCLSFVLVWLLLAIWPSKQSPAARTLSNAILALNQTDADIDEAVDRKRDFERQLGELQAPAATASQAVKTQYDGRKRGIEIEVANAAKRIGTLQEAKKVDEAALAAAQQRLEDVGTDAVLLTQWHGLDRMLGDNSELRLLLLVIVSAALGSMIHASRSFAGFTGRGKFDHAWNWWYFLRLPTGVGIALLFYFFIRGGFFAAGSIDGQSVAETVNPFGVAAMSAIAGMFARQTSDKVEEIFLNLFRTSDRGGASNPHIVVSRVQPIQKGAVGDALKIAIEGRNFDKDMKVLGPDNQAREIKVESSVRLVVRLLPSDAASGDRFELRLYNPPHPGGSMETAVVRIIDAQFWPRIDKATAQKDGDPATVTLTGANFSGPVELLIGPSAYAATGASTSVAATVPRMALQGAPKCRIRLNDGQLSNEQAIELI